MKYVALLRGINVGGNNKVDMKRLKAMFETLGFTSVATYINSGNVIFASTKTDSKVLADDIERAMAIEFGLTIKVVVVSEDVIQTLDNKVPAEWTHDSLIKRCDVLFLWPDIDQADVVDSIVSTEVDELVYYPGAVVWRLEREDYNRSGMNKLIGSEVYKKSTARNINTVRKLAAMLRTTT